jgi:hypothetical protein
MNTKMPSELVASPSVKPFRLCRKKPFCAAPAAVRARVFWVTTPRTSYRVLLVPLPDAGARGDRLARGVVVVLP